MVRIVVYPAGFDTHRKGSTAIPQNFPTVRKPGSFVINVSADNRFRLFVNGVSVAVGPARGDLEHWRYDTLDIGGHLKKGKNSIAAIVWNYASQAPIAQITFESGFVLDGATKAEEFVATPAGWKAKNRKRFRTPKTAALCILARGKN